MECETSAGETPEKGATTQCQEQGSQSGIGGNAHEVPLMSLADVVYSE